MAKASGSQLVSVAGHRLKISNLDKVLYPESGTTKADVLGYYAAIAPVMLPHVDLPSGHAQALGARSRDSGCSRPDVLPEGPARRHARLGSASRHPALRSRQHLSPREQRGRSRLVGPGAALEIHVPQWRFTADGARRNPDRIVLDLDPGDGIGLAECAEVARLARTILTGMGLDPLPVTSGSKGIHLYAQLDERQTSDQVSAVARELARALEADHPDLVVSDMKKTLRTGKVLVDWSQNNGNKTTIAPYSLRGRFRPTVAAPRTWKELSSPNLAQLEYDEVLARVAKQGDALAAIDAGVGPVPDAATPGERATAAAASGSDRLSEYRAKRDAAKTPEPVPDAVGTATDGRSFVIQEHHARRLHYDLRLEHDGVLVSWAVPKGVPVDPGRNHLAVQTEDHPLEYGGFEGTIPAGEYGAGTMRIWDSGSYELEKWRDDEVIVTLTGSAAGGLGEPVRIALIRTSTGGRREVELAAASHEVHDPALLPRRSAPLRTGAAGRAPGHARAGRHPSPTWATGRSGPSR